MNVQLDIPDPQLRSYLGTLFERTGRGYRVNSDSLTGAAISALARSCPSPVRERPCESIVTFFLPRSHHNNRLRNKFLYLTPDAQAQINAILKKEYQTHFFSFCTEMRMQGFQLKDAISVFIDQNHPDLFDGDIGTLKKKYYRAELERLKNIRKRLSQLAYHHAHQQKAAFLKGLGG